jgi:hydrogenase nickel incorporation protein HypB
MTKKAISIIENILSANDQIAAANHAKLNEARTFSLNIMASPGAGKTSIIEKTIQELSGELRIAVIEGDLATSIDAERVQALGAQAVQINTGGGCHLEAGMIQNALMKLDLNVIDLLLIENVGNLVCPSSWILGEHKRVLVASIPEGDDKPYKYPTMYRDLDALIINKIDLMPYVEFDLNYFKRGVESLTRNLASFETSCKTGDGLDAWFNWIRTERQDYLDALKEQVVAY